MPTDDRAVPDTVHIALRKDWEEPNILAWEADTPRNAWSPSAHAYATVDAGKWVRWRAAVGEYRLVQDEMAMVFERQRYGR
jgi:hypothetical protein